MAPYNETQMRQDFRKIGWALVLSQLTMFFLSVLLSFIVSILLRAFSPLRGTWSEMEGWIVMLSALGGALPMLRMGQERHLLDNMFERREKAWPVQVIFYFLMILGLQMLTSIVCAPVVHLLESVGASFDSANNSATAYAVSASMLVYSVVVAPVVEELVYRGALLRALERYGRWFAIVISALIFGLMHGNAVQFPVAFVIGLAFGYLSLKYSLKLTIVLHVLNNLFVDLVGRISDFSESLGGMIDGSLMLAGVLSIILMALSGGKLLLRDIKNNRTPRGVYKWFFASMPVVAIFCYMIALTIASIWV